MKKIGIFTISLILILIAGCSSNNLQVKLLTPKTFTPGQTFAMQVKITDQNGKPVKGAKVSASLTMKNMDHGTYPYVTSSHPVAGAACIGSGVGPSEINKTVGVVKAYTTRVGEGPFPTELSDADGELIRQRGHEFGTTTGRPRRCGWLDVVILRYAARVNGLNSIAVTKLDVLDGMEKIKICVAYKYQGELLKEFPASLKVLAQCEPVYEECEGWMTDTTGARSYDELPLVARRYLVRISELIGVKTSIIAIGPMREQTIVLETIY
jgi:adenylosuccinate synthase